MKGRPIRLPAPYLKRVWLDPAKVPDATAYPFCLPFLSKGFEVDFERAVTVSVGENGTGKSTLLEGIAALAGYDEAGGGKGYRPVDPVSVSDTDHYRLMREFCADPKTFIATVLTD